MEAAPALVQQWRPAKYFADRLREYSTTAPAWSRRELVAVLAVLLAALALRVWAAAHILDACPDGIMYIGIATAWEQGSTAQALGNMGLNLYPLLLAAFHHCGVEWELAGKIIGVAAGTLTLLPLYGWLRWQFDRRVAWIAAWLYAVHPKLVIWSPELMRDSVFWLLAVLSIYLSWRAVCELRIRWFVALAVVLLLAQHTRFEGWFLALPPLLWTGFRALAHPTLRRPLAWAAAAFAASYLALWLMLFHGLIHDPSRAHNADWSRLRYTKKTVLNVLGIQDPAGEPAASASKGIASGDGASSADAEIPAAWRAARLPLGSYVWTFVHTQRRGLNAIFGLLMFGGLWKWRSVWLRRDNQAVCIVALLATAGALVHLWDAGESSSRYSCLTVILASPFAALALLGLASWLGDWSSRLLRAPKAAPAAFVATLLVALGTMGGEAMQISDQGRHRMAEMGRWLHRNYAPHEILCCEWSRVQAYYGADRHEIMSFGLGIESVAQQIDRTHADLLVFSPAGKRPEAFAWLNEFATAHGYRPIDRTRIPASLRVGELQIMQRISPIQEASQPQPLR